jgi:hypothetical protein
MDESEFFKSIQSSLANSLQEDRLSDAEMFEFLLQAMFPQDDKEAVDSQKRMIGITVCSTYLRNVGNKYDIPVLLEPRYILSTTIKAYKHIIAQEKAEKGDAK